MNKDINIDRAFEGARKLPPAVAYSQIESQVINGSMGSSFLTLKIIIMSGIILSILSVFVLTNNSTPITALELKTNLNTTFEILTEPVAETKLSNPVVANLETTNENVVSITDSELIEAERIQISKPEIPSKEIIPNSYPLETTPLYGSVKKPLESIADTTLFIIYKTDTDNRVHEIGQEIVALANSYGEANVNIKSRRRKKQIKSIDFAFNFKNADNYYKYRLQDDLKKELRIYVVLTDNETVQLFFEKN